MGDTTKREISTNAAENYDDINLEAVMDSSRDLTFIKQAHTMFQGNSSVKVEISEKSREICAQDLFN